MAAVAGAGGKPTGPYAERMLEGAWPQSDPADLYAQQRHWEDLRDQAHDAYRQMRANNVQLMQVLDSDGFDALHRDRELVARNFDFLAEVRDNAAKIWGRGAELSQALRNSMSSTVHLVEQQIAEIEAAPLIDENEKQALIDALIEDTNIQLVGESTTAAEEFSGLIADHVAYSQALPWHVSTADPTVYTTDSGTGARMMSAGLTGGGWKQDPVPTVPGQGGQGTGASRVGRSTSHCFASSAARSTSAASSTPPD